MLVWADDRTGLCLRSQPNARAHATFAIRSRARARARGYGARDALRFRDRTGARSRAEIEDRDPVQIGAAEAGWEEALIPAPVVLAFFLREDSIGDLGQTGKFCKCSRHLLPVIGATSSRPASKQVF